MTTLRDVEPVHTIRRVPLLAVAGVAALGVAVAGTLFSVSPADAAQAGRPTAPAVGVSLQPIDVAVATFSHRAYVATPQFIDVVDTQTHQRVTMVSTSLHAQTAITLVQAGAKAYVGSSDDNKLAIFDPVTNTVTGTVKVGQGTTSITDVITPKGEFAYVTQVGKHVSRVVVVNAQTDTVVDRIHLAGQPYTATQTPDLKRVWVGTDQGEDVKVINPATQKVVKAIPMKRSGPVGGIAFGPKGQRAYVTGEGGMTVVKVSSGQPTVYLPAPYLFRYDAHHGIGINTTAVAVGPHGTIDVVNTTFPDAPHHGSVSVLDRRTLKVISNTRLGVEPSSIAMDQQGRQAFFTNFGGASLSYVSTKR